MANNRDLRSAGHPDEVMGAGRVIDLAGFNALNPSDFVHRRRGMLEHALESLGENRNLLQLQEDVDHMIAVDGVPLLALLHLSEQISTNLQAIASLSRQLIGLLPAEPRSGE